MKHLKLLALASMAAFALVAFGGAGAASATTLCTIQATPCPPSSKVTPTSDSVIAADLVVGTSTVFSTFPPGAFETCTGSTMKIVAAKPGSATETTVGSLAAKDLTFTGCVEGPVASLGAGELEIHWIAGGVDGTLTAKGLEITVMYEKVRHCVYALSAMTDIGKLTGSKSSTSHAMLEIEATLARKSGFLCPSQIVWQAEYTVTEPKPLYVVSS